jgi:exonuclease VII large subunit
VQDDGGAVVTDAAAVAAGDRVAVRLSRGRIAARVEGVDEQ